MPHSAKGPSRCPIDRAMLVEALGGDRTAMKRIVPVVGRILDEVSKRYLEGLEGPDRARRHRAYLFAAWLQLVEDDFAGLRAWDPSLGSFEQHVTLVVAAAVDAVGTSDHLRLAATEWTPRLVGIALDERHGPLNRELARYIVSHLRRCAFGVASSFGKTSEPEDLAQEFAFKLYQEDGRMLRQWNPARSKLPNYIKFIARRSFRQQLMRVATKGKVVVLRPVTAAEEPESPDTSDALAKDLHREAVYAALREELEPHERTLLDLVVRGVSAEEGSKMLGVTPNAFHQRKHRLVKKMREMAKRMAKKT